ncbi:hypothetical protein [Jeotgalibacillus haloalkalitolerans]|uniref:RelA/SpoT domain-containing protein n=1 Tax=Jeotgalibacillus haloalkalitolerans TaxID=3104292 RepID=A0ABU5KJB5_9BACL|nr:hypothetical protein [Jeotgalibacillus sp. HH7-29]MDZ5711357.1 hypothetical protein [Jeotgalibacillus sp. HH7-29]
MDLVKAEFLQEFNIDEQRIEAASIDWNELLDIYNDYIIYRDELRLTTSMVPDIIRMNAHVHSVKTRIKNPKNLIHKVIRKTIREKRRDEHYVIHKDNYKSEITDLIGIRVLHLYKDQAIHIDSFIRERWNLKERCKIYYRSGDYSDSGVPDDDHSFEYKVHEAGYRSWHYLIESNVRGAMHTAEIQVRTIFEEGWSEVDHQLRYPNNINNSLLTEQLLVLNRIAGSADELTNTIRETKIRMEQLTEGRNQDRMTINHLRKELERVQKHDFNTRAGIIEA